MHATFNITLTCLDLITLTTLCEECELGHFDFIWNRNLNYGLCLHVNVNEWSMEATSIWRWEAASLKEVKLTQNMWSRNQWCKHELTIIRDDPMTRECGGARHYKTVANSDAQAYIESCDPDSCPVGDSRLPRVWVSQNNTTELYWFRLHVTASVLSRTRTMLKVANFRAVWLTNRLKGYR